MRSSLTSRFPRKTYNVKYYHDINPDTQKWEVIELPSNNVIKTYNFEEDASELAEKVEELLNDGWVLSGGLASSNSKIFQALTKV